MAIALANSRDGEGLTAKASLEDVASIAHHKHQMFRHGYAGQTRRGCHVEAPVAPYELQACELGGRVDRPSFSRIQIDRFLPLSRLRARAVTGCASLFHSSRNRACKPFARHTLPVKQLSQSLAYRNHHQTLSSSVAFAGFNTSEATDGRVPNSAGAFQKTEGELPNVGS